MRGNRRLGVAGLVCLSPFVLTALMGKESFFVFTGIMLAFAVCFAILCIAHWAIETVLVALGFNKNRINQDRSSTTLIFWGN